VSSREKSSKGRAADQVNWTCKDVNACILTILIHAKEGILKDFLHFFNRWMVFSGLPQTHASGMFLDDLVFLGKHLGNVFI